MDSPPTNDTQLQALVAEGLSQTEIAKRLGIPRSTIRDRLKRLDQATLPPSIPPMSTQGIHNIHTEMFQDMMADLHELVLWWQERKASLHQVHDTSRETRRVTFFVEKRWEEAIRRQSDLDGVTYTQIVNEAFRQYFS